MNHMRALAEAEGQKKCLPKSKGEAGGIGGNRSKSESAIKARNHIVNLVATGPMTARQIMDATDSSMEAVRSRLRVLAEYGTIKQEGDDGCAALWVAA